MEQTNIKINTYNTLTRVHTWPEFSNSVAADKNESYSNSLENIHNNVHYYVGGKYGHMALLELAGEYPHTPSQ